MRCIYSLFLLLYASGIEASPLGFWVVSSGDAVVSIERHEAEYRLRLISLLEPGKKDTNNPSEDKRDNNLAGAFIGGGFSLEDEALRRGWIYDPDSGKTYKCRIELQQDGTLTVTGYLGIPKFGRSQRWRSFDEFETRVMKMIEAVQNEK